MDHLCDWSFAGPGHPVWLSDSDEAFVEASIVTVDGPLVTIVTKAGKKITVDTDEVKRTPSRPRKHDDLPLRLLPRAPHTAEGVENMDELNPLNEATIVANIETRFRMDLIYTRTGPILIAMNPFKRLPIYQDEIIAMYCGRRHGSLPPHCYQEAEDAYQLLGRDGIDQSVIICGESGAGKTETTKKMLRYISTVARPKLTDSTKSSGISRSESMANIGGLTLGERMVDSNALTEAFGNAKTVRNNNSSRFGKFTLFSFSKRNTISGGRIRTFLLEKSRVSAQPLDERNYHVFYQLLAGAPPEWHSDFHLGPAKTFHYLNMSGCMEVSDINDSEGFDDTCDAMDKIQIGVNGQKGIFQVVAGVLHVGQIEFKSLTDGESCEVSDCNQENSPVAIASKLLGLSAAEFTQALVTRVRIMPPNQEPVASPQTADQARDSRDALSKALYSRLFDHLVLQTNNAFDVDGNPNSSFIGILDIFGFEDLVTNTFEQVFINYTNEKLQSIFNDATFRKEVEEYTKEKIPFDRHDFPNNQPCLDLIEKKPMGLLHLLDSECLRGAVASDQSLVNKLHRAHKNHANYLVCGPASGLRHPDGTLTNISEFIIKHYAGPVIYETSGFVDKNKDCVYDHLYDVVSKSSIALVCTLFPTRVMNLPSSPRNNLIGKEGGPSKAVGQTVATRFTTSLNELTEVLSRTQSRFVRCVKTNNFLKPQIFDKPSVLRQLKSSGVMAALEIRRAGYPTRVPYSSFVKTFRVFDCDRGKKEPEPMSSSGRSPSPRPDSQSGRSLSKDKAIAARMMTSPILIDIIRPENYRFGLSKIFFQADVLVTLQTTKDRILLPYAVKIQRWWLRKQEHILEHLLTRTMQTITTSFDKATIHGVQNNKVVYDALNEAIGHVRYAKCLDTTEAELYRPALERAMASSTIAREEVDKAAARKQHESQQRAKHLGNLDSGRARIGRIKEGCSALTINKAKLEESIQKAESAIEACREELLRAATLKEVNTLPPLDVNGLVMSFGGSLLQGSTHHSLALGPVLDQTELNAEEFSKNPEFERRMQICEEALMLVEEAEKLYTEFVEAQESLEIARTNGKERLEKALKMAESANELAVSVGIGDVSAVLAASKNIDAMHTEALIALEENSDVGFDQAVEAVNECAKRFVQIVAREKEQKEEDDRREEGRIILRKANALQTNLFDQAITMNVQNRSGMMDALAIYESKLESARSAEAGSASSFICAANLVLVAAEAIDGALTKERQYKESCNRTRQLELARLEPPIILLANLEASCVELGIIREPSVVKAISKARSALELARHDIENTEDFDAAELTKAVTAAIAYTPRAERVCADAKQKKEAADREIAIGGLELNKLDARLSKLRVNLAEHPDAGLSLLSTCDEVLNAAVTEIAKARRYLRQCISLKEMHSLIKAALQKVEEAEKSGKLGQLRAAALLRRRANNLTKLKAAGETLGYARSSLTGIHLEKESQDQVQCAIEAAETSLRVAQEEVFQPVSPSMLQSDSGDSDEESAVIEATKKVEVAEAVTSQAVANAERLSREWNLNSAMLSAAIEKQGDLKALALRTGVSSDVKVMSASEVAEIMVAEARTAVHTGSNLSGDPYASRNLIESISARLTALDATIAIAQRDKEELGRQHEAAKALLDRTNSNLAKITTKANSSGSLASALCRCTLEDANEAIQSAQRMLRHSHEDKNGSGNMSDSVSSATAKAVQQVEYAEQFVQRVVEICIQAKSRRLAASIKLDQISASFAEVEEKIQQLRMDSSKSNAANEVYLAIQCGQEALNSARELVDNGHISNRIDDILNDVADFERSVDSASKNVSIAEEAADAIVAKHQRAGVVIAQLTSDLKLLTDRHNIASNMSPIDYRVATAGEDCTATLSDIVYPSCRFAEAFKTVEVQIEAVHNAISLVDPLELSSSASTAALDALKSLRESVRDEEVIATEERQKAVRRQMQANRAQTELPLLIKRLENMKKSSTSLHSSCHGGASTDVGKAEAAIESLTKFSSIGYRISEGEFISVDSVIAIIATAESAVHRQQGRSQRAEAARKAAILRFDMSQAHFNEVALAAASFSTQFEDNPSYTSMEVDKEDVAFWQKAAKDLEIKQKNENSLLENAGPAQLVSHAFACTEFALSIARQHATASINVWIEEGGIAAAQATERVEALISSASSLVQRERQRLNILQEKRTSMREHLNSCAERATSINVAAEVNNVLASDKVSNPLYAAESLIASTNEVIEKGSITEALASIEEIQQLILTAESALAQEIRRKENLSAARRQAKNDIVNAISKLKASQASYEASGYIISQDLDKLTERAQNQLESAMKSITEEIITTAPISGVSCSSLATLPRIVSDALKSAAEAEAALSLDHATRRETAKRDKLKEATERVAARKIAEEKRAIREEALRKRRELQDNIDKLDIRLSIALPSFDELAYVAEGASNAVYTAKGLISKEDISDSELAAAAAAYRSAKEQVQDTEAILRSVEVAQAAVSNDLAVPVSVPRTQNSQHMGEMAASFNMLTVNMQTLMQSMMQMQRFVQHQSRIMHLQSQLVSGMGDRESLLQELALLNAAGPNVCREIDTWTVEDDSNNRINGA